MGNNQKGIEMAENAKDRAKNIGLTILKIVTFPIWIIPALILGAMLPDDWRCRCQSFPKLWLGSA